MRLRRFRSLPRGDGARVPRRFHLRPVSSGWSERETGGDETLDSTTHTGRPARPSRYLVEQRRHSAGTAERRSKENDS